MKTWRIYCNRCKKEWTIESSSKPGGSKLKCPNCGFSANGSTVKEDQSIPNMEMHNGVIGIPSK